MNGINSKRFLDHGGKYEDEGKTLTTRQGHPVHAPMFSTLLVHIPLVLLASLASAQTGEVRTGAAALADWKADAPGVRRHIKPSDLPAPPTGTDAEKSVARTVKVVKPAQGALPKVPDGFAVQVFARRIQAAAHPSRRAER